MGQLGVGDFEDKLVPTLILGFGDEKPIKLSCGRSHSAVLTANGTVYTFGSNSHGQLGIGLEPNGVLSNFSIPMKIISSQVFIDVACGALHCLAQTEASIFGWGRQVEGQIGIGPIDYATRPTLINLEIQIGGQIATRGYASYVISNGILYVFGSNEYGQLGLGLVRSRNTPVIHDFDGAKVDQISVGYSHVLISILGRGIFGFGRNDFGQLGSNDISDKAYPNPFFFLPNIPVSTIFLGRTGSFSRANDGSVYVWGGNYHGEAGFGKFENQRVPVSVTFKEKVQQISTGRGHSLLLSFSGRVWSWGLNHRGQLGLGDPQHRLVPTLVETGSKNISKISAGTFFSFYISSAGNAFGFGANYVSQLGLGDQNDRWRPVRLGGFPQGTFLVDVSSGVVHSLFLDSIGRVFGVGSNRNGELGLENFEPQIVPILIHTLSNIVSVSAGSYHSLALDKSGQLFSFGRSSFGVLGLSGNTTANNTRVINSPQPVEHAPYRIVSMDTSETHSLAITTNGIVLSWGSPEDGKIGRSNVDFELPRPIDTTHLGSLKVVKVSTATHHSLLVTSNGKAFGFGNNTDGQSGQDEAVMIAPVAKEVILMDGQRIVSASSYSRHSLYHVINVCNDRTEYDENVCSGHGDCNAFGRCVCKEGYLGQDCELISCFGTLSNNQSVCGGNGRCSKYDVCECKSGWSGRQCETINCFGVLQFNSSACSSRGKCVSGDTCLCNQGFVGKTCEDWSCFGILRNNSQVCGQRGRCTNMDVCSCDQMYSFVGNDCDTPLMPAIVTFFSVWVTIVVLLVAAFVLDVRMVIDRLDVNINRLGMQKKKNWQKLYGTRQDMGSYEMEIHLLNEK